MPEQEPLNQNQAEPVDNERAESSAEKRNVQIEEGNYIENLGGDYYQSSSVVQEIFKNVRARDITVGDISVIYNSCENLDNIPKPKGFPQNIISSSTDKFVGREKDLESLNQKLKRENEVVIAAVEGMGGVGKTELAIQYSLLNLQLNTYPGGICWLRSREQDIGSQIVNFVRTDLGLKPPEDLEMPERVRWCWKHWQSGNTLVVLDDVKNYSEIKPYLPPQPSQFKVLITTRLKLDLPSSLYLEVLEEEEAVELLRQLIGREKVNQELETAKVISQRLGCLPLALQLVGRYVKKRKISLAEELRRLEGKGLGHSSLKVKEKSPTWTQNIKRGVQAAFELSWDELNAEAQELGSYLSLFEAEPFKWSWVESAWIESSDEDEREEVIEELEELRDDELVERNLLKVTIDRDSQSSTEPQYQLHALIAEYFRAKLKEQEEAEVMKQNFCWQMIEIAQSIPQTPTQEDIRRVALAIPHLTVVAKELTDCVNDENLIWSFAGLGKFYEGQGAYDRAEEWCERSVTICRSRLGEEHTSVATSLNNLAALYDAQGRYEEAEPFLLEALEMNKRMLGEEHPSVATSIHWLAFLYYRQGRYEKAEPLYIEALEMYKKLLGEEHPDVARSLNNLAALYRSQGRYSEAEPLYVEALAMRKKLLGEEHPDVATSMNDLANLYKSQGRYEEAEPLYVKALEMYKQLLGEEHPDVATSLNNLALLYKSQGRYERAEPLYVEALEMYKKLLGEEHPYVATSLNNLALLYDSQGRYEEAEPLYVEALKKRKKLLGEEHPDVATSLNNLAGLYDAQGRYEQAELLYKEALEMRKKLLGEEHPDVAMSLNNLALLYKSQGRYERAEPLYVEALAMSKKLLGQEHPDVATSMNDLANLYKSQGRYEEAEPLYVKALEMYKQLLGEEHPSVATSLNNLAALYYAQGKYEEAEPLFLQALEMNKKLLGEEHPNVATGVYWLAFLYHKQGRYSEAEPLYVEALAIAERVLGKDHPNTRQIRENYQKFLAEKK